MSTSTKSGKKSSNEAPTKRTPEDTERSAHESEKLASELAEQAMDPANAGDVEKHIQELSPHEAEMFLSLLEAALKKRKILLFGYLTALICLIGGTMFALYMYGTREDGEFVAWAWLVPFCLCGGVLWGFGRWAKRQ